MTTISEEKTKWNEVEKKVRAGEAISKEELKWLIGYAEHNLKWTLVLALIQMSYEERVEFFKKAYPEKYAEMQEKGLI